MRTLKALKFTSLLQAFYCVYCFVPIVFLAIGDSSGIFVYTEIGISLFGLAVSIPIVSGSFIVCMCIFISEIRSPEQSRIIGSKWLWIIAWPLITTTALIVSGMLLIYYTGGV